MRLVSACSVLLAVVAATSCSSPRSGPPQGSPIASIPSSSPPPASTASSRPAPTTSTAVCALATLAVSERAATAGAGHGGYVLRFRNTGRRTCGMTGYPGVDGVDKAGHTVVHATRTLKGYLGGADRSSPVVLAPGQTASVLVEGDTGQAAGGPRCYPIDELRVTPPGETRAVDVPIPASLCYPEVHPVVPGESGGAYSSG